ncbi:MAG: BlaI/MecI/CopY family transcriptional regulator, partial [Halobacteria archaeon]|nr:BlaI/MecI/CopY family transcriptional regulator [Halobacteria archaeon]
MIQKLTKKTEEVLEYFFKHPTEEVHIRGLSDATGVPYSSVRNALHNLEEKGLVKKREESKMTFYTANRESDEFRRQKRVYNLETLYNSGVIDALDKGLRPDAIVLFGSYLQGSDTEESDIDIAVEYDETIEEVTDTHISLVADLTRILGRDDIDVVRLTSVDPRI